MFQLTISAGAFALAITCCVCVWRGAGRDLKRIAAQEALYARRTQLIEAGVIDWAGFDRARADYERSAR